MKSYLEHLSSLEPVKNIRKSKEKMHVKKDIQEMSLITRRKSLSRIANLRHLQFQS